MYIIVGVDTGKTSAIACLSLSGKYLFSAHKRDAGPNWIVGEIQKIGTPIVIANDKHNGKSDIIRKITASFNASLFLPNEDLSMKNKKLEARIMKIKNPHERDAYTSALNVYNKYANKLKQAERIAKEKDYKDINLLKAKVIKKYSINEIMEGKKANRP